MTTLYDLVAKAITSGGQVLVPAADGDVTLDADLVIELAGRLAASDYDSNPEIWVEKNELGSVVVATSGPRYDISSVIEGLCWVPGCDRLHLPDLAVCSRDLDAEVGPPDAPTGRAARIAKWRECQLDLDLARQEVAALDELAPR